MARLSLEIRNSILYLLKTGKSQRELARIVKVSQSSVNYFVKKFIETGEIKDRPKNWKTNKSVYERQNVTLSHFDKEYKFNNQRSTCI